MKKRVVIVGTGPAGLMAATQLLEASCEIVLVDQKAAAGRKFLVAGDGGFNLTNGEEINRFLTRYDTEWVKNHVSKFDNNDFVHFLNTIGISTYVGSSGKVFPQVSIKPIEVLNAWLKVLRNRVEFRYSTQLLNFAADYCLLQTKEQTEKLEFDFLVLALGGASWSKTGSDGKWAQILEFKGVSILPFESSNCGVVLQDHSWRNFEGQYLKNIVVSCMDQKCSGDITITKDGMEGKPIYAVVGALRKSPEQLFHIDFKPQFSIEKVIEILNTATSITEGLKRLHLPKPLIFILKNESKEVFTNVDLLAEKIKSFNVKIEGFRPIEESISVVGGIPIDELDEFGALKKLDTVFCAGEMIDWDAPTGGYLIQGCVSNGFVVGKRISELLVNSR